MANGYYKAAIFLATIGEDRASDIMKTLGPKQLQRLGAEINQLSDIPQEDLNQVFEEVIQGAKEPGGINVEGTEYVLKVLTKALGEDQANRVMENMGNPESGGMEALKWLEPKGVATLVKGEHPQTVAIILSTLETEQTSEVLPHLPEELRNDVMIRIATMEDIPPGVIQEIGETIQNELLKGETSSLTSSKINGVKMVADILNQMDQSSEQAIMSAITEHQEDLSEDIRSLMFVFDDLVGLDDRSIQALIKEISNDELGVAFRAAKEEVKERFFSNMSERAALLLKEDMEAKGPLKLSEVEKTQQTILKTAKRLADEGTINIEKKGSGGGEVLI